MLYEKWKESLKSIGTNKTKPGELGFQLHYSRTRSYLFSAGEGVIISSTM
jgi:hypothetical protein